MGGAETGGKTHWSKAPGKVKGVGESGGSAGPAGKVYSQTRQQMKRELRTEAGDSWDHSARAVRDDGAQKKETIEISWKSSAYSSLGGCWAL